jgi:histone H4
LFTLISNAFTRVPPQQKPLQQQQHSISTVKSKKKKEAKKKGKMASHYSNNNSVDKKVQQQQKKGLGIKTVASERRQILQKMASGITKNDIRRLARRGGVKRISGEINDEVRVSLCDFLRKTIHDAVQLTECAGRKTVTTMDVVHALKRTQHTIYGCVQPGSAF